MGHNDLRGTSVGRAIDAAGMVPDDGKIGRDPFPVHEQLPLPASVQLHGEYLDCWWDLNEWNEPIGQPPPTAGALDAFIRVRDDAGVVRFVRRFGPLGFCRAHGEFDCWDDAEKCERVDSEPIASYLGLAESFRRVLTGAARLTAGEELGEEERTQVLPPEALEAALRHGWDLVMVERIALAEYVDRLIDRSGIRPSLSWWEASPSLDLTTTAGWFSGPDVGGAHPLVGVLALQLARTIAGMKGTAVCSACLNPYFREHRSAPAGRDNYCPDCWANGTAERVRKQRYRDSKRAKEQTS